MKTNEERFKELCNQPPIEIPKIGSKIYVPTSLYLSHGMDDFVGGLATVESIEMSDFLPPDHSNYYTVTILERPGTGYNLRYLLKHQEEWKKTYGDNVAHPDPDDTPEFNRWD